MTYSKLGTDRGNGQLVYLSKAARVQGLYIVGLQGMGKSGLISNLVIEDIRQGTGVCVLDPKRDLIDNIIARLPSDREKDVILLDVTDEEYPFGLNLFECPNLNSRAQVEKTVDRVVHIFEKLLGVSHDTPLILQYLKNCTYTLVANQGYTMADIRLLLENKTCRQQLVANVKKSETLSFWHDYDAMSPSEQRVERSSTLRRVDEFLQEMTKPIVGQSVSTIDLQQIMDEGKILLVKLDRQMEQVTTLVGSMIVALILNASASRKTQRQFHLYADEFQRFATDDFATLLEEARYAAVGITMAHQNRAQLEASDKRVEEKLKDRTLNVGNLVVFYVPTDADELAGQFDTTAPPAWEEELEEESVEVLEEEWFERVEEVVIDGEEEIKTPVKNVVKHLLERGEHKSAVVNQFATTTLSILNTQRQYKDSQIDTHFHHLNTVLYHAMVHKQFDIPLPTETLEYFMRVLVGHSFYYAKYAYPLFNDFDMLYPRGSSYLTRWDCKTIVQKVSDLWTQQEGSSDWQHTINYLDRTQRTYLREVKLERLASELERPRSAFHLSHFYAKPKIIQGNTFHDLIPVNRTQEEIISLTKNSLRAYWKQKHPDETWYVLDVDTWVITIANANLTAASTEEFLEQSRQLCKFLYNPADLEQDIEDELQKLKTIFLNFITELKAVCQALADDPIEVGSGLTRPRKRIQINILTHPRQIITHPRVAITHPQPTSAEMEKKNENQLLQLDLYQAWVKMIKNDPQNPGKECLKCGLRNANGARYCVDCNTKLPAPNEYLIETLAPKKGLYGKLLQERIDRIKAHNRKPDQFGHVYCRPIQEVEAEIAQRQTSCSSGASPALQPYQQLPSHTRQAPTCPNCGKSNPRGSQFCNQCGTKLNDY